ncbi:L-lysine 6-transaminase [Gracilimonas mengyeensis]|uniref:L-lysine-epsilon aminotransferase n=1 Tax=Gracilimonas mengyeensis TaxID=1302730 RepID=A0A521F3V8_9BACT|nr:L-lysine 6-transaminase [Gracilimonas mengyeensis]SMO90863.1 L-lysine 6-transaminase precursor [Gracilimonas mengyeensis]
MPEAIHTINPENVRSILSKHMLTDGYELVLDLEESEGPYLYDAKTGERYLDFFTFFASNPLGMNHPKLAGDDEFVQRLGRVAINKPSNSDIYTEDMALFMESFDRVGIPDYMPYSFFISGGALAVENAMKVAFDWKVQKNFEKGYREEKGHKILHFEKAFHGRTGYTLSVTNTVADKVKYFPKFDWPRVVSPAMTFPATRENLEATVTQEKLAIAQAERYFETHKDDIAGILIEPIQGEGGDRHFRPEFHQALRDLADKHEALLIYDEVQTGVGMTGKFWAHEHFVKPDILAFGKKAQVCGILAGKRVDEVKTNCFHVSSRINSTWGGNLVDMVRFGKILDVIEEENLVENAATVGNYLQTRLEALADNHEHFSNPRGKGLFCAIDLPSTEIRNAVIKECVNNGLMILSCGPQTVRFRPPLTIETKQIDEGLDILEKACKTVLEK